MIESSSFLLDTTPVHAISNALLVVGGKTSTVRGASNNSTVQAGITSQAKAAARSVNAKLSSRQGDASKQYEQDGSHGCRGEERI